MPETRSTAAIAARRASTPHEPSVSTTTSRAASNGPTPSTPSHRQNGHATRRPPREDDSDDSPIDDRTAAASSTYVSPRYSHSGPCSLTSIATQAAGLGVLLGVASLYTIQCIVSSCASSTSWRLPAFLSICALFHFLEFYATARWNSGMADRNSFLIVGNGIAQPCAYAVAMGEFVLREILFKGRSWVDSTRSLEWAGGLFGLPRGGTRLLMLVSGLVLIVIGQVARSMAMREAGASFNHLVQFYKREDHVLVTIGIYRYIRHPSYFGFFYWALGTQLLLENPFSFIAYALVLWKFFSHRVRHEEKYLISFFGDEYKKYRTVTPTWIPFVGQ
ncbi:Protein-S-isoprenylcysteine O-methyltransferase [Cyphellophora attinorum]|uniref:Protein-S-isoprenylcysteine O-methyltransferase n=1 Tax=Cyphellophora attinorum TaxID=1664694 RepID=A0A0N0NLQ2_9EURO|nr:Protein-S-isoprenylcysteine O-methyltransferase [Phialophora attinorum]KPI39299.1 Protein-S-isoprenylcysteine O-methyltransferase [Phialophora attinorum]